MANSSQVRSAEGSLETGSFVKRSLSVWREGCAASLGTDEKAKLGFSAPLGLAPQALGNSNPVSAERRSASDPGVAGGRIQLTTAVRWQPVPRGSLPVFLIFVSEQRHGPELFITPARRGRKLRRTAGGT